MTTAFAVLGALAMASGIMMEVLRQAVIVPRIRKDSAYSVGVSLSTLWLEAREYAAHCRSHGAPLTWWRLWWLSQSVFFSTLLALAILWGTWVA